MEKRPTDFGPFIRAVNAFVLLAIMTLLYLLFGKHIDAVFAPPAEIVQTTPIQRTPASSSAITDEVVDGIHQPTGLVFADGFDLVRATCTACHSAKLVTQNRATRAGWAQMIDWMQATQGLWDLKENEPIILDYLAKHYAPEEVGRRANIDVAAIEWYVLDLDAE